MLDNVSSQAVTLILVSTAVALLIGMGITVYFTKRTKTNSDWAIGGRKVPTIVLIFTMFATQCGGGVLVGHIGIAYSSGYAVLAYLFAGCAGLLLMILAANWFRKNEFVTIPDIFRKLYGENKFLLIVSSIMAMVVPFGWICSQSVSFGKMFASLTGVNIVVLIAIFLIICVLFTLPSGFNSVVWSDFVFGVMMLILCLITAGQALSMGGGWSNILANFPEQENVTLPGGILGAGVSTTLLWIIAATPGMMTNQMSIQRVCAADSVKNARKVLYLSVVLMILMELWVVVVGITTRSLVPALGEGEDATGIFLAMIPVWSQALFAGLVTTTILTTTDSSLHSVSVNVTNDIYAKFINQNANDAQLKKFARISTVVIAALAFFIAVSFQQVLNLIVMSYSYAASGLLVPIYFGYAFSKKHTLAPITGIISMIAGVVGCAIFNFFIPTFLPAAFYGIIISFVAMVISHYATEKKNKVGQTA